MLNFVNCIRFFIIVHSFTIKLKHGANIREISEIAKGFLVFNIVPQIAQMYTDFFPATIYYPQMRPIRSDDADDLYLHKLS